MAGLIIALIITVPVILLPVALIWYINTAGMFVAVKETREKKLTAVKTTR
ncbi:MAG: hypothetical protein P8105_08325 [Dehalococcoidia bacterium]